MFPGLGVDPTKLAQVQHLSKHVKGTITVDYGAETVLLFLESEVPEARTLIPQLLQQFSEALATQLTAYFAIEGQILEIAKKE